MIVKIDFSRYLNDPSPFTIHSRHLIATTLSSFVNAFWTLLPSIYVNLNSLDHHRELVITCLS